MCPTTDPGQPLHRASCDDPRAPWHAKAGLGAAHGQVLRGQARLGHADAATALREYAYALLLIDGTVADAEESRARQSLPCVTRRTQPRGRESAGLVTGHEEGSRVGEVPVCHLLRHSVNGENIDLHRNKVVREPVQLVVRPLDVYPR